MVRLLHFAYFVTPADQRLFQSHYGAIATQRHGRFLARRKGFNPTMVRLLLVTRTGPFPSLLCFNPTMVRLLLSAVQAT